MRTMEHISTSNTPAALAEARELALHRGWNLDLFERKVNDAGKQHLLLSAQVQAQPKPAGKRKVKAAPKVKAPKAYSTYAFGPGHVVTITLTPLNGGDHLRTKAHRCTVTRWYQGKEQVTRVAFRQLPTSLRTQYGHEIRVSEVAGVRAVDGTGTRVRVNGSWWLLQATA